jgi:hypothetical protein
MVSSMGGSPVLSRVGGSGRGGLAAAADWRAMRAGRRQRSSGLRVSAVAAPPETLLEKGGPGTTYGNGAVAKVCRRHTQWWWQPHCHIVGSSMTVWVSIV